MNDATLDAGETVLREQVCTGNDTAREFPRDATLHQLISTRAMQTPTATAPANDADQLSYGELERRSNQLPHQMRAMGFQPARRVALFVARPRPWLAALRASLVWTGNRRTS